MTFLFMGTPGSGKSFHAVAEIVNILRGGKKNLILTFGINERLAKLNFVGRLKLKISNSFKIKFKKYNEYKYKGSCNFVDLYEITPEYLINFANENHCYLERSTNGKKSRQYKEGQTRVYIDECHLIFGNRDWNTPGRREWLQFFSQHRKYGFDIILITQNQRMVDKQIQFMIETIVSHRSLRNYNWFGKLLCLFIGFKPIFVGSYYWQGVPTESYYTSFTAFNSFISRCYNSYESFEK